MNASTEDIDSIDHGIRDGDLPAFPTPDRGDGFQWPGMTLRDYFAAKALPAMPGISTGDSPQSIARGAYLIADAMLKERGGW